MKGKWMYNLDGGDIWRGEEFDTKEIAIEEGRKEAIEQQEEIFCFRIGQIKEVPVSGVDVDDILMNVSENTTNDVGEVGEDYLCDVDKKHSSELEDKLNEVLFAWIKKYNYEPTFFQIYNEKRIEM